MTHQNISTLSFIVIWEGQKLITCKERFQRLDELTSVVVTKKVRNKFGS